MKSVEEIEAKMNALEGQREALKAQLRALEKERCAMLAMRELEAMPEAKREALMLLAKSVASAEGFGKLGG